MEEAAQVFDEEFGLTVNARPDFKSFSISVASERRQLSLKD